MNLIVLFNTISFVLLISAGMLLIARCRDSQLAMNECVTLLVSVGLYSFIVFSNILEHSGITSYFDSAEDIAEVLFPMLCIFFINNWRTQRSLETLMKKEAVLQDALKRITAQEEKYRQLVESANDAIFIVQEGRLQFFNQSTLDLLQYTAEEISATPFLKFVHPEDRAMVLENYTNRLNNKDNPPPANTFKIVTKDQTELTIQLSSVAIQWKKNPATLNFVRDISEQVKLEQNLYQAQKMESIGTLAGGIAHDFNNILAAIIGYTEMAKETIPSKTPTAANLDKVLSASNRAKDLVKQILAFSRKSKKELKPVEVHLVVSEALKLLRSSIPTTIELHKDIDPQSGSVLSDSTQLHQIVMNLCTNAYHAMRETGGVLAVSLKPIMVETNDLKFKSFALAAGTYLELVVSDTGIGIDRKKLDKIFDPYFTTKAKGEGTGLGLSVVHGIVKNFRGHISVYSEFGVGTTFRVYLPRIVTNRISDQVDVVTSYPTGNEKCLIIDDEEDLVALQQLMLSSLGYTVTAVTSSSRALDIFKKDPAYFDFLITDMTMPHITGSELVRRIHEIRADIPILLVTGFSELIDGERASIIGAQKFLMKPIVKKELAAAIREVLDN